MDHFAECIVRVLLLQGKTQAIIKKLGGWYKCACGERFICEGSPHWKGWSMLDYVTKGAGNKETSVIYDR